MINLFLRGIMCGLLFLAQLCMADSDNRFVLRKFNAIDRLPVDEIRTMHQDHLGFMWVGTPNGLYRYDGFHVKGFHNTEQQPFLLTSESITCMADDEEYLWIGTKKGLNRMNLRTGFTKPYHLSDFDNSDAINKLLVTHDNVLWVGTEGGLYRYDAKKDCFELLCDQRGNSKVPHSSVTSLYENSRGILWIGTWDRGLYRYNTKNGSWYELPPFNPRHSAQSIYEDKNGVLWVGTWHSGLYKIQNPYETNVPLKFRSYTVENTGGQLSSNIVWSVAHDAVSDCIWIGMPNGLALLKPTAGNDSIYRLPSDIEPGQDFFGQGAGSFFTDREGRLWISGRHRGIVSISKKADSMHRWCLPEGILYNDYITALSFTSASRLLVGLHGKGFLDVDLRTPHDCRFIPLSTSVYDFYPLHDGRSLVFTERQGMLVYRDGNILGSIDRSNSPWLPDNCIYSMATDSHGIWIIGTYKGLCLRYKDGRGVYLDDGQFGLLPNSRIVSLAIGKEGIWIGTRNNGLFLLKGDLTDLTSLTTKRYDVVYGSELKINAITKVLVDKAGRVWACSSENGLLIYDAKAEGFVNAGKRYGLPSEKVYSIEESSVGDIMVSMRNDIAIMRFGDGNQLVSVRFLSRRGLMGTEQFADALSSVSYDGMVCFGGYNGLVAFNEAGTLSKAQATKAYVTDVKIFNRSLDFTDFADSASVVLPPYSDGITLSAEQHDVTIEFSTLDYVNPDGVRFSYMLEGYDSEWRFTDANTHHVNYNNLRPGRYVFHLRATDSNGDWGKSTTFMLKVLQPWYLRWYSCILYVALVFVVAWIVFRYYKSKEQSRREVQMARLEKQNMEELNHKKLQFFTNITHDLMTPLTVISATVSALADSDKQNADSYRIIDGNVNRLMRLLQQILEFRKSETGNQHLLVSHASLSDFLTKETESLRPLANKKQLHFSFISNPDEIDGFFDSDKLDKIMYNLVSNAIKYTPAMGFIQVTLTSPDNEVAVITVKDNGVGIAADKLPQQFTRFYEGEHRKFKTYGTGIGLSLTKDLIELHHGSITVNSTIGEGTLFTVTLPIVRTAFSDDEIDDTMSAVGDDASSGLTFSQPHNPTSPQLHNLTVMVVEDNEELLTMLVKLLSQNYNVVKAYNGKEALAMLEITKVDIILTDVMMPVMDGIELTKAIHASKTYNMIPVIMLTAKRDDEDRAEAYRAGADAYITKPFNTSVLMARIENLLSNRMNTAKEINARFLSALKDVDLSPDDEKFVSLCIECVQQHIADTSFDLDSFARAMNISKSTLYKKLHGATSLSPSTFIRDIRMKYASELLCNNPKARVADVAYAVGFNDPKYFSACFKKEFGVLPSDYGKSNLNK